LLSAKYGTPYGAKDFEEALRILEGGFVAIAGDNVRFINPSLRDYLVDYLDDAALLADFALAPTKVKWASAVWQQAARTKPLPQQDQQVVARGFANVAKTFLHLPVWKPAKGDPHSLSVADLGNYWRITLLLEWCEVTGDPRFADYALALARKPVSGFSTWLDGDSLVELISELRNGPRKAGPNAADLASVLETGLVDMLRSGLWADELDKLYSAILDAQDALDPEVLEVANEVVNDEFENAHSHGSDSDSESTLQDHIEALRRLAQRAGIAQDRLENAVCSIENRIQDINEKVSQAHSPSVTGYSRRDSDVFDDTALRNLFEPLVRE
jgi:hypothetical protein